MECRINIECRVNIECNVNMDYRINMECKYLNMECGVNEGGVWSK